MPKGQDTRHHPARKVGLYDYRDRFNTVLTKHMAGDSTDYEAHLKKEGFLTPSGKVTGAGRTNPMARTDLNWDK